MKQTENALDVAIQGRGYLIVETPNGEDTYTRDGTLKLSPDGEIVTKEGYTVRPSITVPDDAISVSINASGEVEVTIDGQVDPVNLGQLEMATFINDAGLEALGNNYYKETPASGNPIEGLPGEEGFGTLLQGYIENANVDPVNEITSLIVAQRSYEMNSKVITASDEMLQALNQSA